jgi:hypothetical protein
MWCFNWAPRHKAYSGSGAISPRILDLGTRWRWAASFTPRPLYTQRNSPWYPLDRRMGEPQSRSRPGGEEKNSQPQPGLKPPNIRPVARRYTTELLKAEQINRFMMQDLPWPTDRHSARE